MSPMSMSSTDYGLSRIAPDRQAVLLGVPIEDHVSESRRDVRGGPGKRPSVSTQPKDGLDTRDRFLDGLISKPKHGLAVATGLLEAPLERLLERP